jgi:hypothetical protein
MSKQSLRFLAWHQCGCKKIYISEPRSPLEIRKLGKKTAKRYPMWKEPNPLLYIAFTDSQTILSFCDVARARKYSASSAYLIQTCFHQFPPE